LRKFNFAVALSHSSFGDAWQDLKSWSRSSIVDTKSIMLPAVVRSIGVQRLPVKDSPVASEDAVDCRTLQFTPTKMLEPILT
jgi:hypothetical protein